jgi:hypothetical protein
MAVPLGGSFHLKFFCDRSNIQRAISHPIHLIVSAQVGKN